MQLIGRLHPLLIHFPIALVIAAVAAEAGAMITRDARWRQVGITNVRAGALFAVLAVLAGWSFAPAGAVDPSVLLQWHRWVGTTAAILSVTAAMAAGGAGRNATRARLVYRLALFGAGVLVGITGHLGGLLVWGAVILRP
jgi:uncharacterized membrane protein